MIPLTYKLEVAGLTRELPICPLNDDLSIAGFVIFGDVELTCECARALLEAAPEYDYMIAPEAKAIPLIHEMAKQAGRNDYCLVRKKAKAYMQNVFKVEDHSITTEGTQYLYMDGDDAAKMRGKRVIIIDDVISTGGSIAAVEELVKAAGGIVAAKMAVLAEGSARDRDDIIYLAPLPLFDGKGNPIE